MSQHKGKAMDMFALAPPPYTARIQYAPGEHQFGDLRLPRGKGPFPVVIGIHGGYWRSRYDLAYFGHACASLTEAGIATWNIEYRRTGHEGGGWPGTFRDVAAAADYLRPLALEYALDLNRVVTLGHSAGGHLALWLAARHRIPEGDPLYTEDPLPLKGAVALAGVVDLRRAHTLGLSEDATGLLMGCVPAQHLERYASASPYELLPLGVRQFLLHGTADDSVPLELSERYEERAVALGDPATLLTLPDTGHFELVDPTSNVWPDVVTTVRLLLD